MQPVLVFFALPLLIGVAFELLFRDTKRATLAAALATPLAVFLCIERLDPGGTWNWLATLLISPLAIGCSLAAVLVCFGRRPTHRSHPHDA